MLTTCCPSQCFHAGCRVIPMAETVSIPRPLLKELYEHFDRIEEILATVEELSNKKGLKRIKKSLEEYKKGECITGKSGEDQRSSSEGLT